MSIAINRTLLRIQELCDERNWSVYKLAKNSNVPYSSLSNMFLRNTQPTISTLEKLCDGLGITMSHFFSNSETDTYILSEKEAQVMNTYRQLPTQDKELLEVYLGGLTHTLP